MPELTEQELEEIKKYGTLMFSLEDTLLARDLEGLEGDDLLAAEKAEFHLPELHQKDVL